MFRNRGGGDDVPADVFIMREKLASIGDDFWIENGAGQKVYKVDGKAVRVRDTLVLEDMNRPGSGHDQGEARQRPRRDDHRARRADPRDRSRRRCSRPLRERFDVESDRAASSTTSRARSPTINYTFERDGNKVAEVSKKWFRVRDSYGVQVQAGEDTALDPGRHGGHRPDDPRRRLAARKRSGSTARAADPL